MRPIYAGLMACLACLALAACAQARAPAPAPAMQALAAIEDAEPDVAQQVSTFLGRAGHGVLATEQMTGNARAAMSGAQLQATSAMLAPCGPAPALELLRRTTKGEDRQYVYRVPCKGHALLVDIDFNKGAKINKLVVRPEQ
ncbi:hypothetical protein [Massilia sp. TSP1-1-2]|uniref:hypothetical protein n=1 Tax=unclassified Massilia TaxID=2609279 RepID=UPI003CF26565